MHPTSLRFVSPTELKSRIHGKGEIALLDVREAGQFGESHLLFSVPVPYSNLEAEVARLVPRASVPIVVCDDGIAGVAERAASRLLGMGYTDVAALQGGTRAWSAAGYGLFAGVNVPSKLFGELVEHVYATPHVSAAELMRMRANGERHIVLDGRPYDEFQRMTIPGAISCPNAELPLRARDIVQDPAVPVIVSCAGRTRSILGAQTLRSFGLPNPVYALENGTQGWFLEGLELARGATARYPSHLDAAWLDDARNKAAGIAKRFDIRSAAAADVELWLQQVDRTTYLLDIRTPEEFEAGTLPRALHAPGGQLVQAADQWVAVRNSRVVLMDTDGVRAPVVASWLVQLGYETWLLSDPFSTRFDPAAAAVPIDAGLPPMTVVGAHEALALRAAGAAILDLRPSMSFRAAHIPGSRWSIRPRIRAEVQLLNSPRQLVLVSNSISVARAAASELAGLGCTYCMLHGLDEWERAGLGTEDSPNTPADADCIDFLFFVHGRHSGDREAAKQYLAWEMDLVKQIDAQERAMFRLPAPQAAHAHGAK